MATVVREIRQRDVHAAAITSDRVFPTRRAALRHAHALVAAAAASTGKVDPIAKMHIRRLPSEGRGRIYTVTP